MSAHPPKRARVIGLTGGIGSGKSTVCELLAKQNIPVVDTDDIARRVVEPGTEGLKQIIETFGNAFLSEHGELNRARLREAIFTHPEQKQRLESILHPLIRQRMLAEIDAYQTRPLGERPTLIVVAIPLLVETLEQSHKPDYLDEIWVVDCPESLQIERASKRDGQNRKQIEAILAQQASREERLQWADRVIHNDGDLANLTQQIDTLLQTER